MKEKGIFSLLSIARYSFFFSRVYRQAIFTPTSIIFVYDVFSCTMNHHAICTCYNTDVTMYVSAQLNYNVRYVCNQQIGKKPFQEKSELHYKIRNRIASKRFLK